MAVEAPIAVTQLAAAPLPMRAAAKGSSPFRMPATNPATNASPAPVVSTTFFTFRAGSFDGTAKRYTPRGFVQDKTSNAVWGMQFLWPIKSDFRIVYLTPDYSQTVIGREKRDYVWIMARTPGIPDAEYAGIVEFLGRQGYDVSQIQKVPQRWPARQGG